MQYGAWQVSERETERENNCGLKILFFVHKLTQRNIRLLTFSHGFEGCQREHDAVLMSHLQLIWSVRTRVIAAQ